MMLNRSRPHAQQCSNGRYASALVKAEALALIEGVRFVDPFVATFDIAQLG